MAKQNPALDEITAKIYSHIVRNGNGYKNFKPEDKLKFVEDAFNLVNEYYGKMYSYYNPNLTKFGFVLGSDDGLAFNAVTDDKTRSICYNLISALKSRNVIEIYWTMFHEFRHVLTFINHSPERFRLYNRYLANETLWGASPAEIGADLSAYNRIKAIGEYGLLKNPKNGRTIIKTVSQGFAVRKYEHLWSVAKVASFGLGGIIEKLIKKEEVENKDFDIEGVQKAINNCPGIRNLKHPGVIFSRADVCSVLRQNPNLNPTSNNENEVIDFGQEMGKFVLEDGKEKHYMENFFGKLKKSSSNTIRVFEDEKFARLDQNGEVKPAIVQREESIFREADIQPYSTSHLTDSQQYNRQRNTSELPDWFKEIILSKSHDDHQSASIVTNDDLTYFK